MYRITVTIKGFMTKSIVFNIEADNVVWALDVVIDCLKNMGYSPDDYDLAHSNRL